MNKIYKTNRIREMLKPMATLILFLAFFLNANVWAQTSFVTNLGASSGWYSDDTRNASGTVLNGLVSSYPPYFANVPGTTTDDAAIASQIVFGNMYTGSSGNLGVLQLDGTTANTGKSSVKYYTGSSIASGSALSTFTSTFRWYSDPYTTSRTPGLSLVVVGSNSVVYSLAYVGEGAAINSWNTFTVNASTTPSSADYGWRIYGTGAPGGTVPGKSLNALLSDPTWGPILSGGTIVAQGFNIGSSQRNCRVGIDWLESSILNNGNRIDFVSQIPSVHNTTQNTYFGTIQAAIDDAIAGDVINVDAGTYTEQVNITKAITLNGPNATIAGNGSRVAEAIIQFPAGAADQSGLIYVGSNISGVTIAGFDLECQDATIASGLFGHYLILTDKVNNLTIRNNRMYSSVIPMYILTDNSMTDYRTGLMVEGNYVDCGPNVNNSYNRGIYVQATSGTIQDNQFLNTSIGIQYMPYGHTTSALIQRNTITAGSRGLYHNYQNKGAAQVTWSQNEVSVAPNDRAGLKAQVYGAWTQQLTFRGMEAITFGTQGSGAAPQVYFNNNKINGNIGSSPYYTSTIGYRTYDASATGITTLTDNSFTNLNMGVVNNSSVFVAATCNWWGTTVPAEIAAKITGPATYIPYSVSDGGACTGAPVTNVTQSTYYSTIQAAINAADAGDVINVAAGTYNEGTITISKAIDLRGAKYGIDPTISANGRVAGTMTGESVIVGPVLVNGSVSNALLNGFYIDYNGTAVLGESVSMYLNNNVSNITISNNVFEDSDYNFNSTPPWGTHKAIITSSTGCSNINVLNNLITGYESAVYLNPAAYTIVLSGNKVVDSKYGFRCVSTQGLTITNNTFLRSGGLQLRYGWSNPAPAISSLTVTGNSFNNLPVSIAWVGYVDVQDNRLTVDMTNNTFEGKLPSDMTNTELFNLENAIVHKLDIANTKGLVIVKANNLYVTPYSASIQRGINAASAGDVINVAAGTFTENVTVDKRLTINGAGATTIINSAATTTPVMTITASGDNATDRLVISNLKVTGATGLENPGAGILVQSTSASGYYTFSGVEASGNQGSGIAFNSTASVTDVKIINNCSLSNNGFGLRIATAVPSFDGLTVSDCQMNGNASSAFTYNPSGTLSNVGTNFNFTNCSFANNSQAGVSNQHDLSFFGFHGNASLTNVSVTSSNGPSTTHKAYGIVFTNAFNTYVAAGTISLNGVTVSGTVGKGALSFQLYNDMSNVSLTNVDISGCTAPWGQLLIDQSGTGIFNIGNTTLKTIGIWKTANVDATSAIFKHATTGTTLDRSTLADCYQIEDQIAHKIDVSALGLVTVKANNLYVTTNSYTSPYTTTPSIQRGIDAATAGDNVNVGPGTFDEMINANKSISLLGNNQGIHPAVGTHPSATVGTRVAETILSHNGLYAISPSADNITIDGFKFTGQGSRLIDTYSNANGFHLTNCIFTNNLVTSGSGMIQFGGGNHTNMLIDYNSFKDKSESTIYTGGDFTNFTVKYNKFQSKGNSIFWTASALTGGVIDHNEFDGESGYNSNTVNIGQGGNIQVSNNYVHDCYYTAFQVGIIGGSITDNVFERTYPLSGAFASDFELWGGQWGTAVSTNVTVTGNTFNYNDVPGAALPSHGLRLRAPETGSGIDASTIHVHNNKFINGNVRSDAKSMRHQGNQLTSLDASCNWFGTTDASSITATIYGNVSYIPYSVSDGGACSGTPSILVKRAGVTISGYSTIQAAISATSTLAGDVIEVAAGTYAEYLNIDKSISILGPNSTLSPNNGLRVSEAIIQPPLVTPVDHAIEITQTGITFILKGITIDMVNSANESKFVNQTTGAANTYTFEHNRFMNGKNCINGNWWLTGTGTALTFNLWDNLFENGDVSNGISIWVNGTNNVDIQNNVWKNNKAWALNLNRVVGLIKNNTFIDTDANSPDNTWSNNQNGFIIAAPNNNIEISNNTFTNNYSSINVYENVTGTLNIHDNSFNGNISYAIKLRNFNTPSSVNLSINSNLFANIVSGGYGIMNMTVPSYTFNAANNYWSACPSVSGNVSYFPYYTTVTGTPGSFVFGGPINNIVASSTNANVCAGLSTTIFASGGSNYVWDNSLGLGASKLVVPLVNTTYNVTGNDANGCSGAFASVEVFVNAAPTVSINAVSLGGGSTELTASGATPSSYVWSTGATTNPITVSPTATTTYSVVGTTATCTGTASVVVTVVTVSAGPNQFICNGNSAILTATVGGVSSPSYVWSNLATTQSITVSPTTTTTYTVTVNGVSSNVTVYVNPKPVANAGADITIAPAGTGILTGSASNGTAPYSYAWTGPSFTSSSQNPTVNAAGTYSLVVSDAYGCVSLADNASVTVAATGYTVSGNVAYAYNMVNNQMHNVTVTLKQGITTMYTTTTPLTGNGDYQILGVANGTYTVHLSSPKPWGGVTSADIIAIQNHYKNPNPVLLNGIKRLAADVDANSSSAIVNLADRTMVNSKRVNPNVVSFLTGNWVFTKFEDISSTNYPILYANTLGSTISITVLNGAVTQNFSALCYGDVDASYTGLKENENSILDATAVDGLSLINFPNPFSDVTTIQYNMPVEGSAVVDIFDLIGNKVASISDPEKSEGVHNLNFNASGMASGIYIYTVTVKTSDDIIIQNGKMIFSR